MLKILIADDHPLIRRGLIDILKDSLPVSLIHEAQEGREILSLISRNFYHILILDISLPGRDGMDILKDVKNRCRDLPVLMLSIQPEEQYALRALKRGAAGCLNKAAAPENLVEAVRTVVSGKTYINNTISRLMLENLNKKVTENPHQDLSEREFQVLLLMASGFRVTDIAEKLHLSIKTVSTYKTRLMEKMGFSHHSQINQYVYKKGLIQETLY